MRRIAESVIGEVRSRTDIVQIVGRYVTLRRAGSRFWGLCPFHSEKTASFQVHVERQVFYCFGCRVGGDVFEFLRRHDGLEFPDAVRALAREAGVTIEESSESGASRSPLYALHDEAVDFYRRLIRSPEGAPARSYLAERGVPEDLADRFRIGFAPARWDALVSHLTRGGHRLATAEQGGLVVARQNAKGYYDRFRGRLLFPILEPSGQVVGFGGRALGEETPKYLNSPESPIYRKSRVLFGLPQALEEIRRQGRVILVEGYFDVLALHRAGLREVVAPCGTALTEEHARRLRRYAPEVVLLFDGDDAGRKAAERALPLLLAEAIRVRACFLPQGEDPDTMVSRSGPEALAACVRGASPLLDLLIEEQLKGAGSHAWKASEAARVLAPHLRALADPIERDRYLREVAARLEVSLEALEGVIQPGRESPRAPSAEAEEPAPNLDPISRTLLQALSAQPGVVPLLEPQHLQWLPDGEGAMLVRALAEATRARGEGAVAYLCSAEASELGERQRSLLAELVARLEPMDPETAERAVRDCMTRLEQTALQREYRDLAARIARSRDPNEHGPLLDTLQRKLEEKRTLARSAPSGRLGHVKQRSPPR